MKNLTAEQIAAYFAKGIDCGQVTLLALSDELGISEETAQKLAAGMGAGMFDGGLCGAYLAGIVAVGLRYGHTEGMDEETFQSAKGDTMLNIIKYKAAFAERFGNTGCHALLGYKIPEEMQQAAESGRMMSFCPQLAADNIALLRELFAGKL